MKKITICLTIYIYIYIYIEQSLATTLLNIFLLDLNFDKSTGGLHLLLKD